MRKLRSALVSVVVVGAAAMLAPSAFASSTPSISLDQSAGTAAGSTTNLGMDLQFADSSGDSPDQLTINLPPGLLANAATDGGACLTMTDLTDTNCQVGTGTVTADALDLVPLTVPVTFDLVAPPSPGDLAGLAVNEDGTQIGTTADVKVRPSGDPNGVGISLDFVLPNTLDGIPIMITEIDSTFDGLRYPTSCPSTPANVGISVNSYDDSTVQTASAPLSVTGCSTLPYAPKLAVTLTKDSGDAGVTIDAAVTQAADEAPSKSLSLTFAGTDLGVDLGAIKYLCTNLASGTCSPVGTAVAVSPLYLQQLSANVYLTGTALGPSLTIVFPAPFPLTLVGAVSLVNHQSTFTGLPDIPLTSLALSLKGGATALFQTNCKPSTGNAVGVSTDQNGDKTVNASVNYAISGCAASSTGSTGSTGSNAPAATITQPSLTGSGKSGGRLSLSFRVNAGRGAAKLSTITVDLPRGWSFGSDRVKRQLRPTGVSVPGAKVKSLALSHGHLVIKLRKAAASVHVKLVRDVVESQAVSASVQSGKVKSLRLTVIARDTKGKNHRVARTVKL